MDWKLILLTDCHDKTINITSAIRDTIFIIVSHLIIKLINFNIVKSKINLIYT